jgi:hypothetical protein
MIVHHLLEVMVWVARSSDERFEAFTTVKIQVEFLWVETPFSDVVGYRRFRGPCFTQKMEALSTSETFVSYRNTIDITTQKTSTRSYDV